MFCEQCGKEIQQDAAFCAQCGTPVEPDNETQLLNLGSGHSEEQNENTVTSTQSAGPTFRNDQQHTQGQQYNHFPGNQLDQPDQSKNEKPISVPLMLVLGGIIVLLLGGIIWGVITLVNINKQSTDDIYIAPSINSTEITEEREESKGGLFEEEVEIKNNTPTETPAQETPAEITPSPTEAPAQTEISGYTTGGGYIIADSSTRYLTANDLYGLSAWEIKLARNEIYARHGRIFESKDLNSYFQGQNWYSPSIPADQFTEAYLNSVEAENVKFIVKYEKENGINQ